MKEETKNKLTYIINLSFFLYFVILIVERVLSVSLSFSNKVKIFADGFNGYTYMLVFLSIGAFLIYLLLTCRENIKALFNKPKSDIYFKNLCISSGILLLSGMVHTEYTTAVIQFIAYGILIIGIIFEVVINVSEKQDKVLSLLSLVYLVCYSMAIPVMYRTLMDSHVAFHVIEGIGSFVLVGIFTYLLLLTFNGTEDLFIIWPVVFMVVFDTLTIAFRWKEEINVFLLIFASLSFVIFIISYIYKIIKLDKQEIAE